MATNRGSELHRKRPAAWWRAIPSAPVGIDACLCSSVCQRGGCACLYYDLHSCDTFITQGASFFRSTSEKTKQNISDSPYAVEGFGEASPHKREHWLAL